MKTALLAVIAVLFLAWSAGLVQALTPIAYEEVTPPASRVTSSTHDGNVPGNTVDNNLSTRWSGYGDGAWIRFDLGTSRVVTHVTLAVYNGSSRKNKLDLQVSLNGSTWTRVWSGRTSGTTAQPQTIEFADQTARYVRYVGHGCVSSTGATSLWNSLTEVEIFALPVTPVPPVPTGLRAFPASNQVTLQWNGSPGPVTEYHVWRRLSQCDSFKEIAVVTAPAPGTLVSSVDQGVFNQERYYYAVSASNSAGASPLSDPVAATPQALATPTPTPTPIPPCGVTPTPCPPGVPCPTPSPCVVPTPTPTPTPILPCDVPPTPCPPGVPCPTPSPCVVPTPTPLPAATVVPQPPAGLHADASAGRVRLLWTPASSADPNRALSYNVFRGPSNCGPFVPVAVRVVGASYTDSGLTDGVAYFYFVVGVNPIGESLDSAIISATPQPQPPAAPQQVDASPSAQPGSSGIFVSWVSYWDADRYAVLRASASGGPYSTLASGIARTADWMSYRDANVTAGQTYYYVVVAQNTAGQSPLSAEASATAPTSQVPLPPPSRVYALPAGVQIYLNWPDVAGATGYRVKRAADECSAYVVVGTAGGNSYQDTVIAGTRYRYVISTLNAAGEGADSIPVTASASPSYVSGPTLSVGADTSAHLSWTAVAGATGYRIYRTFPFGTACHYPPVPPEPLATVAAGTTTYTDTAVTAGLSYNYSVAPILEGAVGNSSPSVLAKLGGDFNGPRCYMPVPCPTPMPPYIPPITGAPSAPGNVTTVASDQRVRLAWSASTGGGQMRYRIYRSTLPCGPFKMIGEVSWYSALTYIDAGVSSYATYYYAVSGLNPVAEGPSSPALAVAVTPAIPPDVPYVAAFNRDGRVALHWAPSYRATSYTIKRLAPGADSFTTVGTTQADSFVDDPGVSSAVTYQVIAAGADGASPGRMLFTTACPTCTAVTPAAAQVSASTNDGNVPANTVDDNLATRWSGQGDGAWIQYDLGAMKNVAYLAIGAYRGHERSNVFGLSFSYDGSTWSTPFTGRTSGKTNAQERFDLTSPQAARYVRYVGHGAVLNAGGTSTWNSLTEVDIFAVP